jgi:hypothetical protein
VWISTCETGSKEERNLVGAVALPVRGERGNESTGYHSNAGIIEHVAGHTLRGFYVSDKFNSYKPR